MKNLICLFIAITTISISAQEKQNDATWGETIDFLREFIGLLDGTVVEKDFLYGTSTHYTQHNIEYRANYKGVNSLHIVAEADGGGYGGWADLSELYYVEHDSKKLTIYLKSRGSRSTGMNSSQWESRDETVYILYSLIETNIANRITKALKHIIYLNNQRKKKKKYKF